MAKTGSKMPPGWRIFPVITNLMANVMANVMVKLVIVSPEKNRSARDSVVINNNE